MGYYILKDLKKIFRESTSGSIYKLGFIRKLWDKLYKKVWYLSVFNKFILRYSY